MARKSPADRKIKPPLNLLQAMVDEAGILSEQKKDLEERLKVLSTTIKEEANTRGLSAIVGTNFVGTIEERGTTEVNLPKFAKVFPIENFSKFYKVQITEVKKDKGAFAEATSRGIFTPGFPTYALSFTRKNT